MRSKTVCSVCYCLWKILARDYSYIMYTLYIYKDVYYIERESERETDR